MHRARTSRRLSDVSHLFLSDQEKAGGDVSGPVESIVHIGVTGRRICRAYTGCGLASAASAGKLNVSLVETGISLPNTGYYFGLEPEEYLSTCLGGSDALSGMSDGRLGYSYSPRPAGHRQVSEAFAVVDRPHLILNIFDSTSLSHGGTIPAEVLELPGLFHIEGHGISRTGTLIVFTSGESDEDILPAIGSFKKKSPQSEVLVAGYPEDLERAGFSGEDEDAEYGIVEIPGNFGEDLASRRLPSGSFFTGIMARVLASMSYIERRDGANAER